MASREEREAQAVRELGESIGYGRTMQLCEQLWPELLIARGLPNGGGAFTVGPCAGFLVPCQCRGRAPVLDDNGHCEWCCGTHRVTKRVREAQRKEAARG